MTQADLDPVALAMLAQLREDVDDEATCNALDTQPAGREAKKRKKS